MNKRMNQKDRKNRTGNRLLPAIAAILLVLMAAAGMYFLTQTPDTGPALDSIEQTSFTERGYKGITAKVAVAEVEPVEAPVVVEPGTVTDLTGTTETVEEDIEAIEEQIPEPETVTEDIKEIEAPEEDLTTVIANAKNYVYTLYTDLEQGSGFLFNEQGDILTNAHVVKDAAYVTLKNSNGQEFNGRVIGISETEDIALVRVPELAGKQPLPMEMNPVETGTKVFALGSPENINNTSTEGEIISLGKSFVDDYQYNDLYEMTAKIKQGSSGGPLLSAETGNILGINSIVLIENADIGYAIPIYTVIEQLKQWAADPLPEEEEVVLPDITQAHFSEQLLRDFITDFYTLIPYSLNDEEVSFYQFFLLPGSQADETGRAMVNNLKDDTRTFQAVEPAISSVEIGEEQSIIMADAVFIFHDNATDEIVSINHSLVYTVVIDEYGDYQISSIVVQ